MSPRHERLKRAFDASASVALLVLLSPLFIAVAVAVWANLGRPILFRQERPGLHARPFKLIKFRTMLPPVGDGDSDEQRLTPFGSALRRSSLDELPELFNVVKGEMSLVGPRPLLNEYLPLYSARHQRRHDVRPGMTGLAQISGRNSRSWPEQFELDVWYVENFSFSLDISILLKTPAAVLSRRGVSASGHPTRERFTGY